VSFIFSSNATFDSRNILNSVSYYLITLIYLLDNATTGVRTVGYSTGITTKSQILY